MAYALGTKRSTGFWLAGGLGFALSCVSWANLILVRFVNVRLLRVDQNASRGWWIYVVLRLLASLLLVTLIWRMAEPTMLPAHGAGGKKAHIPGPQMFDPLMGLRAFACFLVVMGHYFLVVMPFTQADVWRGIAPLLESSPWAGVWVFFTLSGFLMGKAFASGRYSLDETGMRSFLRNRLLRIAPIYYGSILVISLFRYPALFAWKNWWMVIEMCLFDFRGDLPITDVSALWSVSTEMQFYVLVPMLMVVLMMAHRRFGRAFILLPIALLCVGTGLKMWMAGHLYNMYAFGYSPLLANLDIFLCGLSISLLPRWREISQQVRRWIGWALCAATLVFYLGICLVTANRPEFHMTLNDYWARCPWLAVVFASIFIYLAEHLGKVQLGGGPVSLLLRAVQWIGTLTYCLYVFHSDVFLGIASLVPKVHGLGISLEQFPLAMLETFAVAALFYYLVEKPFESRKRIAGSALMDAP